MRGAVHQGFCGVGVTQYLHLLAGAIFAVIDHAVSEPRIFPALRWASAQPKIVEFSGMEILVSIIETSGLRRPMPWYGAGARKKETVSPELSEENRRLGQCRSIL